jgi:hypothetical protein
MCLGEERTVLSAGQAVYILPNVFHQLTNIGSTPRRMLYCYGPAGDVARPPLLRRWIQGPLPDSSQVSYPCYPSDTTRQSTENAKHPDRAGASYRSMLVCPP